MSNTQGTRWRGQLPIPPHAHPLVRRLVEIANEEKTTLREIGSRAGCSFKTISDWRYRGSPGLANFEAAVNALGYELHIRPMKEQYRTRDRLPQDMGAGEV